MGETGCGKTRLIKFMCALQQPPGVIVENMILMKVLYFDTKIELMLIRNVLILRIQYFYQRNTELCFISLNDKPDINSL